MAFYKLNDEKWQNHRHSFRGTAAAEFSFKVDCKAGKVLMAEAAEDLLIEGKHESEESYVNLATTGINVSEWAGEKETFDILITPSAVTGHVVKKFSFKLV